MNFTRDPADFFRSVGRLPAMQGTPLASRVVCLASLDLALSDILHRHAISVATGA